jgi:murein DD-endopeptidase MepM/ murein hydrolase activator NlpD
MADYNLDEIEQEIARRETKPIISPISGDLGGEFNDKRSHGPHMGGDLYADPGTPVVAPGNMEILYGKRGGTNLRDNDYWLHAKDVDTGVEYRFAHTGDISHLKPGQIIPAGEQFATVGNVVDKPHLHMSMVDPSGNHVDWMRAHGLTRGDTVIAGSPLEPSRGEIMAGKVAATVGEKPTLEEVEAELARRAQWQPNAQDINAELARREGTAVAGVQGAVPQKPQPEPNAFQASPEAQVISQPGTILDLKGATRAAMPALRPTLEYGGLTAGSLLGAGSGLLTAGATSYPGALAGGTLGYGMGARTANALDEWSGGKKPETLGEIPGNVAGELGTGALTTMAGEVAGPVLKGALGMAGKVVKPLLGKMSGTGGAAIDTALQGSKDFTAAMRGDITGEEIVGNAKAALQTLKDARGKAYTDQLAEISKNTNEIDMTPIQLKLRDLMTSYRVGVTPEGDIDLSTVAIGNRGRKEIKDMIETVWSWKDKTPLGVDALKRYLSDFYAESSQARAFTTSLTKEVAKTLENQVPEYANLTKPYAEATNLIKDLEAGLTLRKQGMTGRVVADQTLRRLSSAMRDNFPLRKELVDILSQESGQDLGGQIAGGMMAPALPHGLAGLMAVGGAGAGVLLHKIINPAFWGVLAASSPRLQGEFLSIYGKGLKETTGMALPVGKIMSYLASEKLKNSGKQKEEQ